MEKKRSVGVTIIAMANFVLGLAIIILMLWDEVIDPILNFKSYYPGVEQGKVLKVLLLSAKSIAMWLIIIVLFIHFGFSMLKLTAKSRKQLIAFYIFCLSYTFLGAILGGHDMANILFFISLYFLGSLIYLNLPKIKEQFK